MGFLMDISKIEKATEAPRFLDASNELLSKVQASIERESQGKIADDSSMRHVSEMTTFQLKQKFDKATFDDEILKLTRSGRNLARWSLGVAIFALLVAICALFPVIKELFD
jgi:hypothetical protein